MNDRIKQLILDAGGHYSSGNQHDWPGWTLSDDGVSKFAELVIEECVAQINSAKLETFANESHINQMLHNKIQLVEQIKQHFGVKE